MDGRAVGDAEPAQNLGQRHVGHRPARTQRRGEHQAGPVGDGARLIQDCQRPRGQRNPVAGVRLHALGRDGPGRRVRVDLRPGRAARLARPGGREDEEFEAQLRRAGRAHGLDQRADLATGQRAKMVLDLGHGRQRAVNRLARRVVGDEPMRHRSFQDRADTLADAAGRLRAGPPYQPDVREAPEPEIAPPRARRRSHPHAGPGRHAGTIENRFRRGLPDFQRFRELPGRPGKGWWSQGESNPRPLECHSSALPAELWPREVRAGGRGPGQYYPNRAGRGKRELPPSVVRAAVVPRGRVRVRLGRGRGRAAALRPVQRPAVGGRAAARADGRVAPEIVEPRPAAGAGPLRTPFRLRHHPLRMPRGAGPMPRTAAEVKAGFAPCRQGARPC